MRFHYRPRTTTRHLPFRQLTKSPFIPLSDPLCSPPWPKQLAFSGRKWTKGRGTRIWTTNRLAINLKYLNKYNFQVDGRWIKVSRYSLWKGIIFGELSAIQNESGIECDAMRCDGHLEIFANLTHKGELLIIYCPAGFFLSTHSGFCGHILAVFISRLRLQLQLRLRLGLIAKLLSFSNLKGKLLTDNRDRETGTQKNKKERAAPKNI